MESRVEHIRLVVSLDGVEMVMDEAESTRPGKYKESRDNIRQVKGPYTLIFKGIHENETFG